MLKECLPAVFQCLFLVISEMWLCFYASEQGEAAAVFLAILQVSQSSPPSSKMHLHSQGWSQQMPFWRKDERCHFYLWLKSLIQRCWGYHLHFFKEAKPSIQLLLAVLLAEALVCSGHSVLQSTWALGPGLGQSTGLSYWLRELELPSSWLLQTSQ